MTGDKNEEKKLEKRISGIIGILSPYFRLQNPLVNFEVNITDLNHPCMVPYNGNFQFFLREGERKIAIAHEVGHCLHLIANSNLPETLHRDLKLLEESVANYSELIYHFKKDPFPAHRLRLSNLLRINLINFGNGSYTFVGTTREELGSFYNLLSERKQEAGIL